MNTWLNIVLFNIPVFIFFLVWSFILQIIAYQLIKDCIIKKISHQKISWLKLLLSIRLNDTSIIWSALWWTILAYPSSYFSPAYFFFFSALWITIYTDYSHMLISRFVSLYLVPVGILLSFFEFLPITPFESIIAAIFGYSFLWIANTIFYLIKRHDGLGQGDLELMACIGSFAGFLGCWFALLIGSVLGTILGCFIIILSKKNTLMFPFGPFLAFGASTYVIFQNQIAEYILNTL